MSALSITSQPNVPSWGLARISRQSNQDLGTYYYDTSAGAGVTAYVIDTGINTAHTEFGGRASWGFNNADGTNADLNGHGTHVSGTIAGVTYGVAKKASVVAVKVLDAEGKGKNDNIIEGIQWVVADAKKKGLTGKSVGLLFLFGVDGCADVDRLRTCPSAANSQQPSTAQSRLLSPQASPSSWQLETATLTPQTHPQPLQAPRSLSAPQICTICAPRMPPNPSHIHTNMLIHTQLLQLRPLRRRFRPRYGHQIRVDRVLNGNKYNLRDVDGKPACSRLGGNIGLWTRACGCGSNHAGDFQAGDGE